MAEMMKENQMKKEDNTVGKIQWNKIIKKLSPIKNSFSDAACLLWAHDLFAPLENRNRLIVHLAICTTTIKQPSGCGAVGSARHLGC